MGGLAQQVAEAASRALSHQKSPGASQQVNEPGVITLVTTPVAGWYPMLAAAFREAPPPYVPVRGIAEVITAAAAVPPALDATGTITRGFVRWIQGLSPSGRSPLLTEAEIGGLWIDSVVEALLPAFGQHPRRKIRVAGIGVPQAGPADSCYLLSSVVSATVTWRPRRRLRRSQDWAFAQWLLISATGDLIGGGIKKTSP